MGRKYDFDYIVIGSGPAGSAAALALTKAKKRVALVEGRYFGGSNLNTRNVPYNIALDFAHTYHKVTHFPEFAHQDFSFNFPTIVTHQLKAIIEAGGGSNQKNFNGTGVVCLHGYANFLDGNTIAIGDQKFTSQNFIIATGSHLDTSTIAGTDAVNYLKPETAIKIRRLPKVAIIIGGGPTGCEIAEYYAKLGAKAIIMEKSSRLLPHEDTDTSQTITNYFTNVLGIMVLPNCKVVALEQDDMSKRVIFQNDHIEKMVRVDCIVLATGSQPNTDLGLENAKVKYTTAGIKTDKFFQTSAKNIYAIGDCLGNESSTERADYEGNLLASNLINHTKNTVNYRGFARVTSTSPTVITIGPTEADLKRQKRKYKKSIIHLRDTTAGKVHGVQYGFVKLLADRTNHIIGGCVVAPDAETMAGELALAVRHNLTALEIASTPHIANSFNNAIKLAAKKLAVKKK
ncbi:NAD(P)/FAD-dependent oxidoreductase [Candidatus Saccharibacteria bacterium]|nr:NAD(P)/FAD-dependent oxidoreductase [Candidatus Saccharibacteria bacterium]